MSCDALAQYMAENAIEICLEWPLKPIMGMNHGRKRPRILTNDTNSLASLFCTSINSAIGERGRL